MCLAGRRVVQFLQRLGAARISPCEALIECNGLVEILQCLHELATIEVCSAPVAVGVRKAGLDTDCRSEVIYRVLLHSVCVQRESPVMEDSFDSGQILLI